MSCQDYEAQIGDYVDGTMDEAQRASVESHLSTCASCRALVERLQRDSRREPDARGPGPAAARVEKAVGGDRGRAETAPRTRRRLLVAGARAGGRDGRPGRRPVVDGGPADAGRDRASGTRPASRPRAVAPDPSRCSIAAEYQLAEQNLTNTIVGLERIAADDRSTLDMETADVLQANLTVLDGAIGESRDALQKEPENDVAQQSLFEALRSKIALLQDTIALINEMRKGNQEGAARIVSGLNQ